MRVYDGHGSEREVGRTWRRGRSTSREPRGRARLVLSGAVKPRSEYSPDDFRQGVPWWAPENFDANVAVVDELTALAQQKKTTLSQLSLAWLLAQKSYIVPIPGSRSLGRVAQNIAAAEVELTPEDLAQIQQIAPSGGIGGPVVFLTPGDTPGQGGG